jgi:hypothetical protein
MSVDGAGLVTTLRRSSMEPAYRAQDPATPATLNYGRAAPTSPTVKTGEYDTVLPV